MARTPRERLVGALTRQITGDRRSSPAQKRMIIHAGGANEEPDAAFARRFKRTADRELRLMAQEGLLNPEEKREVRRIVLNAHAEYMAGRSNERTLDYILNETIPDFVGALDESADSPTSREREWGRY